ncbi:pyrroloquinoline quinone biosynthesis protein PqqF [Pseudomonas sp. EA_105y_Pfl2_R69]|uniref:pyrroloquinoline quinone biosynthesis protein PqqF n=1 Tax=Pseudomonas sp. EA_105y_Pfl2_R69 TaxID=3088683 RepID=UPI0030DA95DC
MSARAAPSEHPGPQPDCRRLGNGLRLILLSQPGLTKAAISLRVAAGSHDEPLEYPGLAHFLEHLLFLGGAGFAREQRLMPFVQACGGQLNASTQAHHTDYFCEVPAQRLEEALARLLDMLAKPLFELEAQVREREVVHAEFIARGQDAGTLIGAALGQALPAGHRFAAFQAGNRQTLAVEQADFQRALRAFHQRFYQAENLTLVLLGPQPPEQLYALAEAYGAALSEGDVPLQSAAAPLLPLRAQHLHLCLPADAPSLHLCFALELPRPAQPGGLSEALDFLQTWLLGESPGGLLANLRTAQLCWELEVRRLYQHDEQALLLLSFAGVDGAEQARAGIAAALQGWLEFFAEADWTTLQDSYRAIRQSQRRSLQSLALARCWQEGLAIGGNPHTALTAQGEHSLQAVLGQMRQPQRLIELLASEAEQPLWPTAGFALRMAALPSCRGVAVDWRWQLPAANPFFAAAPQPAPLLSCSAQLRWLAAPDSQADGQGALYWRCCFAESLPLQIALAVAQEALRETQASAAQAGVSLHLSVECAALQLVLQGSAEMLVRVAQQALPRLLQPAEAAWQLGMRQAQGNTQQGQMPIRQLLQRLPRLLQAPDGVAASSSLEQLQGRYREVRLEGLGVGLPPSGQRALEALFASFVPLVPAASGRAVEAGRYWLHESCDSSEATLLLFCPQPAADAASEAGWRLLAHFYQGAFFQRLRGELQLGYAVFCGFRQVQGQAGILFAVQSPHASTEQILGHIEDFVQAQGERLASQDEGAITLAAAQVQAQLHSAADNPADFAEQHWLLHLAGLPASHVAAVVPALEGCDRPALLHSQALLSQGRGGWYVLANSAPPASGWVALD